MNPIVMKKMQKKYLWCEMSDKGPNASIKKKSLVGFWSDFRDDKTFQR